MEERTKITIRNEHLEGMCFKAALCVGRGTDFNSRFICGDVKNILNGVDEKTSAATLKKWQRRIERRMRKMKLESDFYLLKKKFPRAFKKVRW